MPKTFTVACPACKKALDVPADQAGEKVECPACFGAFEAEKAGGGKMKVVSTYEPPAKSKAKKKPAARKQDDDDDDYDHDHRRSDDDDDEGDSRQTQRVYNIRAPGVALTLGILSVLF